MLMTLFSMFILPPYLFGCAVTFLFMLLVTAFEKDKKRDWFRVAKFTFGWPYVVYKLWKSNG